MKPYLVAAVLIASACTTMDQYFDGKVVTVDGAEYLVRETRPGTYQAMPNDPKITWNLDASVWPKNVRAIEIATGCKVNPAAVKNGDQNTIATVDC
ncbi:hypothetical protein JJJ17_06470 [Paracoccus caeni]|uniref:Lipoprotein n=1 Tax=Paracoccus caeni TaxID=657651 RepID=A0A934VU92_9RHOB|nr:hypothetical protein [Paracoccus caeni]MBK4215566.1 hypothetical protein [Paracoccus caeni]